MSSAHTEFAPAKINLALAITGRRPDGYHLIDTLAVFADIGDRVEAELAAVLSLEATGPFAAALGDLASNLVLRAGEALRAAAFGAGAAPGARLKLKKVLPVASGIGGGSADAAATLRLLNRLWGLDWPLERLADIGVGLGADIPMCLHSQPLRARGIGEDIAPLSGFPALDLVLVNPGVPVSTAEVFAGLGGSLSKPPPDPSGIETPDAVIGYLGQTGNALEPPAIEASPVIGEVLGSLRASTGCLLARMSGSGATCFGVYADRDQAEAAAGAIASANRLWWAVAASTGPGRSGVTPPASGPSRTC